MFLVFDLEVEVVLIFFLFLFWFKFIFELCNGLLKLNLNFVKEKILNFRYKLFYVKIKE